MDRMKPEFYNGSAFRRLVYHLIHAVTRLHELFVSTHFSGRSDCRPLGSGDGKAHREKEKGLSEDLNWPDELDAVIAAPDHHRVLLENDRVRVLDTRIEPGDTVPLHTHRWSSLYHILSWSDFVRRDADGNVVVDSRESLKGDPPQVIWSQPLPPHTLENVGPNRIHLISVELKA